MYDTGTVRHGYVIIAVHKECFLVLLVHAVFCTLIKGLVFLVFKVFALVSLYDLICGNAFLALDLAKNAVQKCFRHDICISVRSLNTGICLFGVYAKSDVTCKCPGCCGPCKEVSVFAHDLETYDRGAFF